MATFRLKRKVFALLADGTGKSLMDYRKEWIKGGGENKLGSFKDWYRGSNTGVAADNAAIKAAETAKAAQRAINKANPAAAAAKAGFDRGFNRGASSVGILGGLKNTWKSGAGKAGLITAGAGLLATGALAAKGLMGNNNN